MTNATTMSRPVTADRILPRPADAARFAWDPEEAKSLGIYGFDSRDIRSRPFNLLRSRLFKLHRTKGWRLFGVVSSNPGVGKSFVATNLGAALSRTPDVAAPPYARLVEAARTQGYDVSRIERTRQSAR